MAVPEITGDPRFFARSGPFDIAALAAASDAKVEGHEAGAIAARLFTGVAPLQTAGPAEVSFLDNRRYAGLLGNTKAGAVIVHPEMAGAVPAGTAALVTPEPYLGWARIAALFHPPAPTMPGIAPSAVVDPAARIDPAAEIGPLAVIGAGAEIAAGCRIGPLAVIGAGVVLGRDCRIGAQVSISHALIGARVAIYPGARIGQDGFGFAVTAAGFVSVPQIGRVIIEDDVEIGANTTIDRGSAADTVIGAGSRLDNLVQVGHNVRIGRACVIVAQAGISGSTVLEDFVMAGGQAGLIGHLHIGTKARIGAQAGVMADVAAGASVVGSPAQPVATFFREVATLRRLAKTGKRKAPRGDAGDNAEGPRIED
jgi:UDP-3-O-[3-hydroxymyristoyl] glucosamine N-acyltransferase